MAFSFDSTVGGASANAYVAVASCDDYLSGRLDVAEWTAATTATQQYAIAMATARIDQEEYVGYISTTTQRLKFPRTYLPSIVAGAYEDSDTIPLRLEQATCELALALLKSNSLLADTGLEAFENVAIGDLDVTPRNSRLAGTLPAQVMRLLRGFLLITGSQVPLVRG